MKNICKSHCLSLALPVVLDLHNCAAHPILVMTQTTNCEKSQLSGRAQLSDLLSLLTSNPRHGLAITWPLGSKVAVGV